MCQRLVGYGSEASKYVLTIGGCTDVLRQLCTERIDPTDQPTSFVKGMLVVGNSIAIHRNRISDRKREMPVVKPKDSLCASPCRREEKQY